MTSEVEHPQTIVYVLGVSILIIAAILVGLIYLDKAQITQEYTLYNLKYSMTAARILNSPECFALETQYQGLDGKTYNQVNPVIIDYNKFDSGFSGDCIAGVTVYAKLETIDKDSNGNPLLSKEIGPSIDASKSNIVTYPVLIRHAGNTYQGKLTFMMKI